MMAGARHPAYRRYLFRMAGLSAAYVASIAAATRVLPDDAAPSAAAIAIALVPGLAVMGFIWAMGRLLVELDDEYLRLIEIRKFVVATGFMLAVASVWGILELLTTVPRVPVFFAFPVWCLGLFVGTIYNRVTLGKGEGCA